MIQKSGIIIGAGGLDRALKIAKMDFFSVDSYLSMPITVPLKKANAFITGLVSVTQTLVSAVFSICANAKVSTRIIKSVPVDVVAMHMAFGNAHDNAVHINLCFYTINHRRSNGILTVSHYHNAPFVFVQFLKILIVNQCKKALRKWNLFHNQKNERRAKREFGCQPQLVRTPNAHALLGAV